MDTQFGAVFMRKGGYRIEGGEGPDADKVTLRPEVANHDMYAISQEWESLKRGKAKKSGAQTSALTSAQTTALGAEGEAKDAVCGIDTLNDELRVFLQDLVNEGCLTLERGDPRFKVFKMSNHGMSLSSPYLPFLRVFLLVLCAN